MREDALSKQGSADETVTISQDAQSTSGGDLISDWTCGPSFLPSLFTDDDYELGQ